LEDVSLKCKPFRGNKTVPGASTRKTCALLPNRFVRGCEKIEKGQSKGHGKGKEKKKRHEKTTGL